MSLAAAKYSVTTGLRPGSRIMVDAAARFNGGYQSGDWASLINWLPWVRFPPLQPFKENTMNKYRFGRLTFGTILTIVMFFNGFGINTWQFWAVYISAWAMVFFQYLEDFNG